MSNGVIGMIVAALATIWMLVVCASETKENFDRALAKEMGEEEPEQLHHPSVHA
ncbi:MAG: hypothetical protein IRZ10_02360 [Thermoflavifilum sp.]|nr:hypothetical protein [Thermoflavifilum sp.]MCL6513236.1 hypothetical protein [Alicyclobacillus sp.]